MKIYYFFQHDQINWDELLWNMSDNEFESLFGCFNVYKRRTGIELSDEYKDTKILEGNLKPLIDSAKEVLLTERNPVIIKTITKF